MQKKRVFCTSLLKANHRLLLKSTLMKLFYDNHFHGLQGLVLGFKCQSLQLMNENETQHALPLLGYFSRRTMSL